MNTSAGSCSPILAHRCSPPRGGYLDPSRFRARVWLPAQERAQIDPPVVFHALRATSATWLFESGVDRKTAARLLGHGSADISADLYARGTLAARKVAAERVGAVFAEALDSVANVVPIRRAG